MLGNIYFFARGTLASSGAGTVYYSNPYDVTGASKIVAELDVDAILGTSPTLDADIETSQDMRDWSAVASFVQKSSTGSEIISATSFLRYVRVKVTLGANDQVTTFKVVAQSLQGV
jgi:hypothetical protein